MNIICAYESGNAQADLLTKGLQASGQQATLCSLGLQSVKEKIEESFPVDVIHFHNASLVASHFSDMDLETDGTYATFIQYDTSELRTRIEAIRLNPYANLDLNYQDESVTSRLQLLSRLYPACIVKDYEAGEYAVKYHSRVYIVPYAIDLKEIDRLPASPTPSNTTPLIIHPCLDESKGTEFIEEVMARLRKKGYRFDYLRVENSSNADTLRKMQEADIIIDQLFHGSYGIISVEAMALGKPVISHIREDLKYKYDPTLPVISANPATLYRNLVPLLEDAGIRESAGKAGREYVEKHHHIDAVINKLIWAYHNEIDQLENSSSFDQRIIFDSMTGNIVLIGEDTEEIDFTVGMNINSPNKQNNQFIFDPMTDNTVAMEEDTETIDTTGDMDIEQNEQAASFSDQTEKSLESVHVVGDNPISEAPGDWNSFLFTQWPHLRPKRHYVRKRPKKKPAQTTTPTKPVHDVRSKRNSKESDGRNSFSSIQVIFLCPNRFYVKSQPKNKTASYFSFDLSKLPSSSIITKAVIILPVVLKKKQKVPIVLIKRNWSPKRAKRKPPIVFPKRIGQLSTKSASRISNWKCTELVKRWHRNHLKNYGVRISKQLWKQPKLVVNFYKK